MSNENSSSDMDIDKSIDPRNFPGGKQPTLPQEPQKTAGCISSQRNKINYDKTGETPLERDEHRKSKENNTDKRSTTSSTNDKVKPSENDDVNEKPNASNNNKDTATTNPKTIKPNKNNESNKSLKPAVSVESVSDDEGSSTGNIKKPRDSDSPTKNNNQPVKKQKITEYFNREPNKNSSTTHKDDDQNDAENNPNESKSRTNKQPRPLSKCRMTFNNTDDEDDDYYSWSKRDIAEYRDNYPTARQYSTVKDNYKFYTNKIPSYPDGDYIDNIHDNWFGKYKKLEYHHGYIQWLFPIQERGLNISSEPLQKHEIELIKKDKQALKRILKSYELMLDFYGFELVNDETGEIRRNSATCMERFHNLNTSSHNYLRITRILKCLGEFDYEYLKFPFLEKILQEAITENTLNNCLRSCKDYWIETLRSQEERRAIRSYARELIDYRNKGIVPPATHCATRPPPPPPSPQKIAKTSASTRKKST